MTSASATTYWISATGSDSAAGTSPSTAFATFGKADSVVVPGDTVRVLSGTYNTTVQTYTAGTLSARITWISDTKWGAKIVGSTNSGNGNWAVHGDYVTVQDFDITGADIAGMVHFGNSFHAVGNRVHDIGTCSGEADGITEWPYTLTGTVYDSNWVYNIANGCSAHGTVVNPLRWFASAAISHGRFRLFCFKRTYDPQIMSSQTCAAALRL